MSRKQIVIALGAVLLVAVLGAGAWFLWGRGTAVPATATDTAANAPAADAGPTPAPVLVVIDRAAIMEMSKAGRDIGRQVQEFSKQTRGQLDGRLQALQREGEALKQQAPNLAPDVRQTRIAAFEKKQAALQEVVSTKDTQVRAAVDKGRAAMEKVLAPILKDVTQEHGVNLVLDKQAVLYATNTTFDITGEVIQKLDAKLPTVKIDFTAPAEPKNPTEPKK